MDWWRPEFVFPVLGALIAGAAVGVEREFRARAAGLRTHILVALTSAVLMLAAKHQVEWVGPFVPSDVIRIDPVRMAHGILTGIGFLCGGVIFKEGLTIHGLTTAASLWTVSGLGMIFGFGLYGLGAGATVLTLVVLACLRVVDHHLRTQAILDVCLTFPEADAPDEGELRQLLAIRRLRIGRLSRQSFEARKLLQYSATFEAPSSEAVEEMVRRLKDDGRIVDYALNHRSG